MLDSNLPLIKWVTAVEIDANKNFIRIVGFIINHKLCTMMWWIILDMEVTLTIRGNGFTTASKASKPAEKYLPFPLVNITKLSIN